MAVFILLCVQVGLFALLVALLLLQQAMFRSLRHLIDSQDTHLWYCLPEWARAECVRPDFVRRAERVKVKRG